MVMESDDSSLINIRLPIVALIASNYAGTDSQIERWIIQQKLNLIYKRCMD